MEYIFISFIAGILTILAPCVLPVLPIIIGGSLQSKSAMRPLVITLSLGVSIVVFTLLLRVFFVNAIPRQMIQFVSGGIILFFGIVLLFPQLWVRIGNVLKIENVSSQWLQNSGKKDGIWGMILIGAALGPVFASCSPTYFVILGTVLPQSFWEGVVNLFVYGLGLSSILFVIAVLGQKSLRYLRGLADPKGWFKRGLGILFVFVGISIIFGWDKKIEAYVLSNSEFVFSVLEFEERLIDSVQE